MVRKRGRFQWTLAAIVLIMFYGYFLLIAFVPGILAKKIVEGSMWPIGYSLELFLFIFFWLTTYYYVRRSNTEFDDQVQDMIEEAEMEGK